MVFNTQTPHKITMCIGIHYNKFKDMTLEETIEYYCYAFKHFHLGQYARPTILIGFRVKYLSVIHIYFT